METQNQYPELAQYYVGQLSKLQSEKEKLQDRIANATISDYPKNVRYWQDKLQEVQSKIYRAEKQNQNLTNLFKPYHHESNRINNGNNR